MKRLLAAAAILAATFATAHATPPYSCAVIAPNSDGWLAVRAGEGTRYPIVRKLLSGRIVRVISDGDRWVMIAADVRGQRVTGWAYTELLTFIQDDNC
jgi:uncharacterized protein YraI